MIQNRRIAKHIHKDEMIESTHCQSFCNRLISCTFASKVYNSPITLGNGSSDITKPINMCIIRISHVKCRMNIITAIIPVTTISNSRKFIGR